MELNVARLSAFLIRENYIEFFKLSPFFYPQRGDIDKLKGSNCSSLLFSSNFLKYEFLYPENENELSKKSGLEN